jgi:hypothetical protein
MRASLAAGADEASVRALRAPFGGAARSSSAWIPARPSSRRPRPTCIRPTRKNAKRTRPRRDKIMMLGGGPNRIGQGIEFDYCCVHAALALREAGYETIMVNCNPETVSTDYDTSDRLYFEPLTLEDVLEIVDKEKPKGVIVQYGGQTPLKLCACAGSGRRADHRHLAGCDRSGRGPRALPAAVEAARPASSRRTAPRARRRPGARAGARDRLSRWSCGRPTCWAGVRWKSSTTTPTCALHAPMP